VTGDRAKARRVVGALWDDLAADGVQDRWMNDLAKNLSLIESAGFPLPSISPYQIPGPETGKQRIREILNRHIDFETIPALCRGDAPELVVGTVDVNAGVFETFTNEAVTVEAVLASAAVPNLFQAVEIHGHLPPLGRALAKSPGRRSDAPAARPEARGTVDNPDQLPGVRGRAHHH